MSSVSVIVPVYKVEQYLPRCIDSILGQSFTDFELILIDDGSPDNCPAICDKYALKDKRIHIIHQENGGLSVARNTGLNYVFANSDSQWITFIDSDDWVSSDYLGTLVKGVQDSCCRVSICGYQKTDGTIDFQESNNNSNRIVQAKEFIFENDIRTVVAWGKLYDKDLLLDIRYPEGKMCEDEFVTYKILLKSKRLYITDKVLYMYFQNSQSIINSQWSIKRLDAIDAHCERFEYFKKNYPSLADQVLIQIWKDCRYQGQMALLNANEEEENIAFYYLTRTMNKYRLSWKLISKQESKEIVWLLLQRIQLKMVCKIRNRLSIGF